MLDIAMEITHGFQAVTWMSFPELAAGYGTVQLVVVHIILTHLPLDKMAAIFTDDIFKCIFMNEKFCISIQISQISQVYSWGSNWQ